MPWGRLDDSLYDHPKLDRLPEDRRLEGVGLWAVAISWSNRFLTDGHLPRARVEKLGGTVDLAELLVTAEMFDHDGSGYVVHDFLDFNDSRAVVMERRQKEAERKAAYRAGKRPNSGPAGSPNGTLSVNGADVPPSVPPSVPVGQPRMSRRVSRAESQRVSRDSPRARPRAHSRPDPSRPVPTRGTTTSDVDAHANGVGPTLSKTELDAWRSFGSEWDAVKAAWLGRGFRLPPSGEADDPKGQRGLLYPILDARPSDLPRWIRSASGKTPHQVIAWVLAQWDQVKADAGADDNQADDERPSKGEAAESLADIFARLPVHR